jgi:hypothetical protein
MKRLIIAMLLLCSALPFTFAQVEPKQKQPDHRCEYLYRDEQQCTREAEQGKDFCKRHAEGMPRCGDDVNGKPGGRTKQGQPCRNAVKVKGGRCYLHKYQ